MIKDFNTFIKESYETGNDQTDHGKNYMIKSNIETICRLADELKMILKNNPEYEFDEWAKDHISTSKDDIEEVFNYIKSNQK